MKCSWHWKAVLFTIGAVAFILVCLLCSPLGMALILALQAVALPEWSASTIRSLFGLWFPSIFLWLLLSILVPVVAVWSVFHLKHLLFKRLFPVCMLGWIILWGGTFLVERTDTLIRKPALARITRQAQPLIAAIEAYRVEHGRYPEKLEVLVPEFISKIPVTGAAGYREFSYQSPRVGTAFASYELSVETPKGVRNHDSLLYWPEKNYAKGLQWQQFEPMGDWVYVYLED